MLLADFHVHTSWSDGKLPMRDVIDLFGRTGHDVIAITDHIVNTDGVIGRSTARFDLSLTPASFPLYLEQLHEESMRARTEYDMVVIAGAELTQNAITRKQSAHVLALGLTEFISADGTVLEMLARARELARVVIACHPHDQSEWFANTFYLWNHREEVSPLIDLWEIACRWDMFPPVSRAKLNYIANSDFHEPAHLYAWKSLLQCDKDEQSVLDALKRGEIAAITRYERQADERDLQVRPGDVNASSERRIW